MCACCWRCRNLPLSFVQSSWKITLSAPRKAGICWGESRLNAPRISVRQVFPLWRCVTGWEAASTWESGTSRELLSRVGGSWNRAEGGLALIFPGSPSFCFLFFSFYLVHLCSSVAPVPVNKMFLSAEPAAVAQRESSWSESGLKLQGGLLGRLKILQIV